MGCFSERSACGFVSIMCLCSLPAAAGGGNLKCEVCQVLCILCEEALEDLNPNSRLDTASAASKVVGASQGKAGPCKQEAIWEATSKKLGVPVGKVQLACRKEMEIVEETMETALANPELRGADLRRKVCGDTCKAFWSDKEVPISKNRASRLREEARIREENEGRENEKRAQQFFRNNADRAGVEVLASGLQVKVLREGLGAGPAEQDQKVTVHYRGLLIDCIPQDGPVPCHGGTEFDSTFSCKEGTPSAERKACEKNKPISFTATQAGTFWLELLPRMREGAHVEAYIPYKLAYGSSQDPNKRPSLVGPKAALIFQVELMEVFPVENSPSIAIPGVQTTYRVISTGEEHQHVVEVGDTVTVHATGVIVETGRKFWSTKDPDQEAFTYTVGGGVIKGWDMGARGMRKGEVRQLQIPSDEAYGSNGFPAWGIPPDSDLSFELEVLRIKKGADEL